MLESFRHVWDRASCVFSTFDIDQLMKIYQHYWKASLDVLWLLAFQSCKICLWISIPHGELPTHPSPNPTDIKTNFGLGKMSVRGGVVSRMFRSFSSLCPNPPPPPTPHPQYKRKKPFPTFPRYTKIYLPTFRTMSSFDWSMSKVEGWIVTRLYTCYIVPSRLNRHLGTQVTQPHCVCHLRVS